MIPALDDENLYTSSLTPGSQPETTGVLDYSSATGLSKESNVDTLSNVSFDISLVIKEEVYKKIMYWVNKSNFEVSGLGKVTFDQASNTLTVIDAVLVEQENGSVSTEMSAAAVGKAMFLMKDTPGDLRFWWHSHVNMSVFWSGTDMTTIKQLAMGGWFVSTVFNKKHETKSAFSQSSPVRCIVDNLPTAIETSEPVANPEWDKEYTDKVKIKEVSFSYAGSYGGYGGYGSPFWGGGAGASEVVDETKDYSDELNARLDKLWERVVEGRISEDQFDRLATRIEDEYDIMEEEVAAAGVMPDKKKKNKKTKKKQKYFVVSGSKAVDEKEEDDLEEYYDAKGNLRLRKRANDKLSNIYK